MLRFFLAYKDAGKDNIMSVLYNDKTAQFSVEIDHAESYSKECYSISGKSFSFKFHSTKNNNKFNSYLLKENPQKASSMLKNTCRLFKPFDSSCKGSHSTYNNGSFRNIKGTTVWPYEEIAEQKHPAIKKFLEEFNKVREINIDNTTIFHPLSTVCWYHSFDEIVEAKKQEARLCEVSFR